MLAVSNKTEIKRIRLEVSGVVQGVGFRPFVYGLAQKIGLKGFVGNQSKGVFIEIEGSAKDLVKFQKLLRETSPPLSQITNIQTFKIKATYSEEFKIFESEKNVGDFTLVSPDISLCKDCLSELFDENNRRFRYPFINCTNCGPRFTITKDIPYDRPNTTMREFKMCAECLEEYKNPIDRRFHAQPNACRKCGPKVWFQSNDKGDNFTENDQAIQKTLESLKKGEIVLIKGIGGFHLAVDAQNESALQTLRKRKGRIDKPFAVMSRNLETAERFVKINQAEKELLESKERPIVLLKKKESGQLPDLVAPNNQFLGVMLPYSPLHFLLFEDGLDILVMTSGNYSNEPIVKDNDEALDKLSALTDSFLLHDRKIYVHCDDSVVRVIGDAGTKDTDKVLPIRRSRGYAPFPVKLPFEVENTLAVGGELKATFCLTKGDFAFMSQHIGDMENLETLNSFERSFEQMKSLFRIEPKIIACDRHPNYLSSNWARKASQRLGLKLFEVQHHHAHIASVMAENCLQNEKVIGFAFDGTGFGDDGAIWGGEVLLADYEDFKRIAHLKYFPLAGGDVAVKKPYRIALSLLKQIGINWDENLACAKQLSETEHNILAKQIENNLNTIQTSSFGRLFDAVASLLNVRQRITYEAQAAIEFEALIKMGEQRSYRFDLVEKDIILIDWKNVIIDIVNDLKREVSVNVISAKFHNAVANLILDLSLKFRDRLGINKIALSGGCFQNVALLSNATQILDNKGFEVLTHTKVPPNDGGLALGQALIAVSRQMKL